MPLHFAKPLPYSNVVCCERQPRRAGAVIRYDSEIYGSVPLSARPPAVPLEASREGGSVGGDGRCEGSGDGSEVAEGGANAKGISQGAET